MARRKRTCKLCGRVRAVNRSSHCDSCRVLKNTYSSDLRYLKARLASIKYRAARKGLKYDLTVEWAQRRLKDIEGMCEATGIPMVRPQESGKGRDSMWDSPSVDRIIPSRGYVRDNCRFVIWAFNQAKGSMSDDKLAEVAREFLRKRGEIP